MNHPSSTKRYYFLEKITNLNAKKFQTAHAAVMIIFACWIFSKLRFTSPATAAEVAMRLKALSAAYRAICVRSEKRSSVLWLNTLLRFIGKLKKKPDKNPTPLAKKACRWTKLYNIYVTEVSIISVTTPTTPNNTSCCISFFIASVLSYHDFMISHTHDTI